MTNSSGVTQYFPDFFFPIRYVFFGLMVLFFRLIIILFKMNTPKNDFEKLKFGPSDLQNILLKNNNDPDGNFFLTQISSLIQIISQLKTQNQNFLVVMTSLFHTSSEYKKFKDKFYKLVNFLATLSFNFKVICISETWRSNEHNNSDLFKLPNYSNFHQTSSSGENGGGLAIFVRYSMT